MFNLLSLFYAVEDPLLRNGLVHSEDEPYLSLVILESVNN